eukprot:TRINITY_DN513_c0_g1_i3.p1 TRINITY_DN513_c0_g1~~TRINITY_DN513_c0_g1_i3.p1  ORF type:complete len:965 (-),score=302.14 TRINITY_DN513_c0_g1_i3:514-3408(-)
MSSTSKTGIPSSENRQQFARPPARPAPPRSTSQHINTSEIKTGATFKSVSLNRTSSQQDVKPVENNNNSNPTNSNNPTNVPVNTIANNNNNKPTPNQENGSGINNNNVENLRGRAATTNRPSRPLPSPAKEPQAAVTIDNDLRSLLGGIKKNTYGDKNATVASPPQVNQNPKPNRDSSARAQLLASTPAALPSTANNQSLNVPNSNQSNLSRSHEMKKSVPLTTSYPTLPTVDNANYNIVYVSPTPTTNDTNQPTPVPLSTSANHSNQPSKPSLTHSSSAPSIPQSPNLSAPTSPNPPSSPNHARPMHALPPRPQATNNNRASAPPTNNVNNNNTNNTNVNNNNNNKKIVQNSRPQGALPSIPNANTDGNSNNPSNLNQSNQTLQRPQQTLPKPTPVQEQHNNVVAEPNRQKRLPTIALPPPPDPPTVTESTPANQTAAPLNQPQKPSFIHNPAPNQNSTPATSSHGLPAKPTTPTGTPALVSSLSPPTTASIPPPASPTAPLPPFAFGESDQVALPPLILPPPAQPLPPLQAALPEQPPLEPSNTNNKNNQGYIEANREAVANSHAPEPIKDVSVPETNEQLPPVPEFPYSINNNSPTVDNSIPAVTRVRPVAKLPPVPASNMFLGAPLSPTSNVVPTQPLPPAPATSLPSPHATSAPVSPHGKSTPDNLIPPPASPKNKHNPDATAPPSTTQSAPSTPTGALGQLSSNAGGSFILPQLLSGSNSMIAPPRAVQSEEPDQGEKKNKRRTAKLGKPLFNLRHLDLPHLGNIALHRDSAPSQDIMLSAPTPVASTNPNFAVNEESSGDNNPLVFKKNSFDPQLKTQMMLMAKSGQDQPKGGYINVGKPAAAKPAKSNSKKESGKKKLKSDDPNKALADHIAETFGVDVDQNFFDAPGGNEKKMTSQMPKYKRRSTKKKRRRKRRKKKIKKKQRRREKRMRKMMVKNVRDYLEGHLVQKQVKMLKQ